MTKRILPIILYELISLISISSVITVLLLSSNCFISALFEGEKCTAPITHGKGLCTEVYNCKYALKLIRSRRNPGLCGFKGNTPLVCCPLPSKLNLPGALSVKKCREYDDPNSEALAFGEKAVFEEFPHMAAIGYGTRETDIAWLCGGSLISHKFVLSAAHCAYDQEYKEAQWIRLGALDLNNNVKTNPRTMKTVKISQIYPHPNYKYPSYYYDIALFEMNETDKIFYPACLHPYQNLPNTNLQVTGWGTESYLGSRSSHLLKATLSMVDHKKCARRYKSYVERRKLEAGILDEIHICAGDAEGRDTCQGDSGGPLHYKVYSGTAAEGHFVLVGITSFGQPCGWKNSIGVYTRVSAFIEWIENIVWPQNDYK
ncbi:serine protease snake-like isoform X2 [Zophobas morio]|uniref:serine protease snake-like isoform X2 n=1 Tax=Zophobas morio TaxID=2755281 RepID=UPI003082F43B